MFTFVSEVTRVLGDRLVTAEDRQLLQRLLGAAMQSEFGREMESANQAPVFVDFVGSSAPTTAPSEGGSTPQADAARHSSCRRSGR